MTLHSFGSPILGIVEYRTDHHGRLLARTVRDDAVLGVAADWEFAALLVVSE